MRSAPNSPAARPRPDSETPGPRVCAAPTVANWSNPAHRHTTTLSTAARDGKASRLLRCSWRENGPDPAAPQPGEQKNKDGPSPALRARSAEEAQPDQDCRASSA